MTSINLTDIRELFEVLEVVQGVTTRWAALRREDDEIAQMRRASREFQDDIARNEMLTAVQRNFDFHSSIARAAKNNLFGSIYSNLLSRTFRLGLLTLITSLQLPEDRLKDLRTIEAEHDKLIDAIERREAATAEALARQHARGFLSRVSRYATENLAAQSEICDPGGAEGEGLR